MDEAATFKKVHTPGSVAVSPLGEGRYDILACNNYAHQVTRHRLIGGVPMEVRRNRVLLEDGLKLPDGVAFSPAARWIAISNHDTGDVLMYRNNRRLDRSSAPIGYLRGAGYPHGVRFTADGQFVFVADAGAPVVRVYFAIGGGWRGTRDPLISLRVLNEETYWLGRTNPQEGGPKGIDIDGGMRVLATTCERQPLAFFDLRATLKAIEHRSI
jgi:DNA-binding beta-propeller fold protein YncE